MLFWPRLWILLDLKPIALACLTLSAYAAIT
jgi:hypothetical protein